MRVLYRGVYRTRECEWHCKLVSGYLLVFILRFGKREELYMTIGTACDGIG